MSQQPISIHLMNYHATLIVIPLSSALFVLSDLLTQETCLNKVFFNLFHLKIPKILILLPIPGVYFGLVKEFEFQLSLFAVSSCRWQRLAL